MKETSFGGGLSAGAVHRLEQLEKRAANLEGYERGELRAMLLSRPNAQERATLERLLFGTAQSDDAEGSAAFERGLQRGVERGQQFARGQGW